jgi:hypothetical protein
LTSTEKDDTLQMPFNLKGGNNMADSRFKKFSNIITEDFPLSQEKPKRESKFLRPGLYNDCVITEVIDKGEAKDPTWIKFLVKIQVNSREVFHNIVVPTERLTFGVNKTEIPFKILQGFCKAIGMELTKENVNIVLGAMFTNPEKLVGFRLDLVLGHDAYYAYPDHGRILIRSKDDKPILGEDGVNPMEFPDFEAAKMFCESQNMAYSQFVRVKFANAPKTPNTAAMLDKLLDTAEPKKKASNPF